jgi:hypothetical protein
MAHVPTRDELYQAVDQKFYEKYPDAPVKLSATRADHQQWREAWITLRDEHLYAEVDRVYWDTFPSAPQKIDPDNPEHDQYEKGWVEIRDQIMSNCPEPPDEDDGELDLSYLRADINEVILGHGLFKDQPQQVEQTMRGAIEFALEEVRQAAERGDIGTEMWTTPTQEIEIDEIDHRWETNVSAWWGDDGRLHGSVMMSGGLRTR